jgi:hypothetical protein
MNFFLYGGRQIKTVRFILVDIKFKQMHQGGIEPLAMNPLEGLYIRPSLLPTGVALRSWYVFPTGACYLLLRWFKEENDNE